DTLREMRGPGRSASEEPERAVDVQPRVIAVGQIGERVDGIEVARVHLAGVAHDDRGRAAELAQRALERGKIDAADIVARKAADGPAPDAEHGERLRRAWMDVAAREDRHSGQVGKAAGVDVD